MSISERGTTESSRQAIANKVKTALDNLNSAGKIELPDLAFAIGNDFNPDQLFTLGDDITENAILGLKSEDVSLRYVDGEVPYYLINGKLTGSTSLLKYINGDNQNFTVTADFADPDSNLFEPDKYIKISPTQVDLVGDISVENLVVAGFGLEELGIRINTIADSIGGTLKLVTPVGGIAGGIDFVRNPNTQEFELNSLSAGGVNLNIPLATDPSGLTVVYFQDLILEYENFAEGATEPLGFGVDSRFTYESNQALNVKLPDWLGGFQLDIPKFLVLDIGGNITTESISADGQLKVLEISDSSYALGSGTADIELNWNNKYLRGSFELEVLEGLAQNSGEFDINLSTGDFTFLGTGSLNLPSIKWVCGIKYKINVGWVKV